MEDENEYKKLPTDEKCVHKLWKARVAGTNKIIVVHNIFINYIYFLMQQAYQ